MARTSLNTTADETLLEYARPARSGLNDAALLDEALSALLARLRTAETDASDTA
jgi:post-segregation antitoxin (ccd killing protein)